MHRPSRTGHGALAAPERRSLSTAVTSRVPRRTRAVLLAAICGMAVACGGRGSQPDAGEAGLAARLADSWDAEFVLERAPTGADTRAERTTRGTVALLEGPGHERVTALAVPVTHVGVYRVDFRPLGFSPAVGGAVPELVAGITLPDSVAMVLPAEARDGILLLQGTLMGDSVSGDWTYGGRAAGGWSGRFVLRRRAP